MSCPSPGELEALLAPGEPADAARATALLAHTRECPRCRAWLGGEGSAPEVNPGVSSLREAVPTRQRPRLAIVGIGALGLGLVAASRTCGPRHHVTGAHDVASVSSLHSGS